MTATADNGFFPAIRDNEPALMRANPLDGAIRKRQRGQLQAHTSGHCDEIFDLLDRDRKGKVVDTALNESISYDVDAVLNRSLSYDSAPSLTGASDCLHGVTILVEPVDRAIFEPTAQGGPR